MYGLKNKINFYVFFLLVMLPIKLHAVGIGSQSWGDGAGLGTGGGSMSLLDALVPVGIYCFCFWLAFSERSPFAEKGFLWQMAIFLFAPSILIAIVTSFMK